MTGTDDQLLLAVDDEKVAILVDLGHIAGLEAAVGVDRLGGRFLVAPVAALVSSATESQPWVDSVRANAPNASSCAIADSKRSFGCSEPSRSIAFIANPDCTARSVPRVRSPRRSSMFTRPRASGLLPRQPSRGSSFATMSTSPSSLCCRASSSALRVAKFAGPPLDRPGIVLLNHRDPNRKPLHRPALHPRPSQIPRHPPPRDRKQPTPRLLLLRPSSRRDHEHNASANVLPVKSAATQTSACAATNTITPARSHS